MYNRTTFIHKRIKCQILNNKPEFTELKFECMQLDLSKEFLHFILRHRRCRLERKQNGWVLNMTQTYLHTILHNFVAVGPVNKDNFCCKMRKKKKLNNFLRQLNWKNVKKSQKNSPLIFIFCLFCHFGRQTLVNNLFKKFHFIFFILVNLVSYWFRQFTMSVLIAGPVFTSAVVM